MLVEKREERVWLEKILFAFRKIESFLPTFFLPIKKERRFKKNLAIMSHRHLQTNTTNLYVIIHDENTN